MSREEVLADVGGMRWGDFKPRLADAMVAHLQPIQQRYGEVMGDEGALDAILAKVGARVGARGWKVQVLVCLQLPLQHVAHVHPNDPCHIPSPSSCRRVRMRRMSRRMPRWTM